MNCKQLHPRLHEAATNLHTLLRFWSKVRVVPGSCWLWTAARSGSYPAHLCELTQAENIARGFGSWRKKALARRCSRGHLFAGRNLYITPSGHRRCKACVMLRRKA